MRTTIYSMLLLAVVVLTMGNTSAGTNNKMRSILQNLSSINLYKEFFEYAKAIMSQGIPALNVPPLDSLFLNVTLDISRPFDPNYPNYTNINVQTQGLNISGFSDFDIISANLSLIEMFANFELYQEDIQLQTYDIVASVVNIDGTLLQYNCSTIYGDIDEIDFTSYKELQLKGTYLHVKTFKLDFSADGEGLYRLKADCTGNEEIAFCILDQIEDVLTKLSIHDIPEYFDVASQEFTIILNDIFALRNVTDKDDYKNKSREHAKAQLDSMNAETDAGISPEAIRRSVRRSTHHKSAQKSKQNSLKIKWEL